MEKLGLKEKANLLKEDFDKYAEHVSKEINTMPDYMQKVIKYFKEKYPNANLDFFHHLPYLPNLIDRIGKTLFKYSCTIILYCLDKTFKTIELHRDFIPKNIKKIKLSPELQADYLVTNEVENANEHLQVSINKFIEMLHQKFPEELLLYFYRNIGSLDTKITSEKDDVNKETVVLGSYRADKNRMLVSDDENEITIFHELFHMASTYYDFKTKTKYSGFCQNTIGKGINEGYTQLLTNRNTEGFSYFYLYETRIATMVEEIVGQEKMQKNYFTANLKGLIEELTKYISEEEVMKFIQALDFYQEYEFETSLLPGKSQKLDSSKQFIEKFLLEASLNKLKMVITTINLNSEIELKDFIQQNLQNIYLKIDHTIISNLDFSEYVRQVLGYNITISDEYFVNVEELNSNLNESEKIGKGRS